ncbi:CinA family protein, partial [Cereibacter sphaeroides]|uniref:CinA family protein n=1 Tax=Cereibacter sphaeroides TaxID=1063 RepID=UPI0019605C8D
GAGPAGAAAAHAAAQSGWDVLLTDMQSFPRDKTCGDGLTPRAVGALEKADVDLAVSITGIAGPGGAVPGKPVGLVHFGAAARDGRIIHREQRFGAIGRSNVRQRSVV